MRCTSSAMTVRVVIILYARAHLITPLHSRLAIPRISGVSGYRRWAHRCCPSRSPPIHGILVYGLAFIMRLSPGLSESFNRRIPGVATSTVPRGHFEGGERGSKGRLTILRRVVGGRPVQRGALLPS